ncbi:SGNH/GDSL hydrolase family protein [Neisseria yangbaofengii]|uniref:SGNH/GDSL hydrolase family protein n=1 Tax=Neisseria yangbaofengii TaxID=2709396 RepID=UPI0013E9A694|nr:SGNH/GDSL hydrolase family protein [Neisseria yangbaofengii]
MTVYLIGDSIRLGYQAAVQAALPDTAILSPVDNCRSSHDVLQHIEQWTQGAQAGDIIHLNCGLHDIRYNAGSTKPLSDIQTYQTNLRKIFSRLQQTGAQIIWASSTPFLQSVHNVTKSSRRYLKDIQAYNQAAQNLAHEFVFPINDLYALMFVQDLTALTICDGLHFNESGNEMLGNTVAELIRKISS